MLGRVVGDGGGGSFCCIVVGLFGRGVLGLVFSVAFVFLVVVPVSCLAFAGGFGLLVLVLWGLFVLWGFFLVVFFWLPWLVLVGGGLCPPRCLGFGLWVFCGLVAVSVV